MHGLLRTICAAGIIAALAASACTASRSGSSRTSSTRSARPVPGQQPALTSTAANPTASASAAVTATTSSTTVRAVDRHILVYGNCTIPSLEPAQIVLTCADYGEVLRRLHWTTWTSARATAFGTLVYNDCIPDCADGHHHEVPGTRVVLTAPVPDHDGHLVWSRVQEHPEPPGYATGPNHGRPQPLPTQPI
jgi:hypothetical protein